MERTLNTITKNITNYSTFITSYDSVYDCLFVFTWNAWRFAIACALLLHIFLQAVSGTSELQIGIPDPKSLPIRRIEAVSLVFSKVSM